MIKLIKHTLLFCAFAVVPALADDKPNILVFWGDDIGITNISAYSDGIMGYRTPNIDRIADEGVRFTDYYGDQSCTAGRSSFITGQSPLRTGLSKVGMPGAELGLMDRDLTIAEVLKDHGYATGQFGKNHLGDKDEHLPTNHGFDEFFGNLYHLNAEEEPEDVDYPTAPWFKQKFGPRGVIRSYADGRIEDTGPLTRKRMENVDEEIVAAAKKFVDQSVKADKPFFVWVNTTGMHFRTHPAEKHLGKSGQDFYNDVMVAHDELVGAMLDQLDELKIAKNTIVFYSTDNGVHYNTWPDAGITPFRSEKNSNWEGAYRVPAVMRWPAKVEAGQVSNAVMSHLDWMPTLVAAAGDADLKADLLKGKRVGKKKSKLHLDGYNFVPYLTGESEEGPRKEFIYHNDGGLPVCVRVGDWKIVYAENRAQTMALWAEPSVTLRVPKIFNLRRDPFERADHNSNTYWDWMIDKAAWMYMASAVTTQYLQTFEQYPPSQVPDSWSIDKLTDKYLQDIK
ncbi:arylsulfatase [Halioglobus japonicus]|uniref:Arylsulfatase n=1 Tax=Halioglobus japonicus TaxID=930805 RepID=A0AAP8MF68_9GAMM|nr:arylsulfatase [Halioglobus japonicus]AQA18312.1 arylsulfatase [Halioglobus japonicus]PLW86329.1 arylsulfatase [Halioglobus japonicus]GHD13416.1 arylsulfatase [Halioglobus japonicus]